MKILICIPCLEMLAVEFVKSLTSIRPVGDTAVSYSAGSLVYTSREKLAEEAIKAQADYVLWLDSDMVFTPDLLERLVKSIEGKDMVTALCFRRRPPYTPPIWSKLRLGATSEENQIEEYTDYPSELFEVEGCGFAAVLMKTEVLASVFNREKMMFIPMVGYGEDVSFCIRARRAGYKIWCDPTIKVGHIGSITVTEETYKAWNKKE